MGIMGFIFASLRQLGMAALIMGCSVLGTVGILKLIKHFFGNSREE